MPEPLEPGIYQLRAALLGISPIIWRRLLVRGDSTIADLHVTLLTAFGWSDDHLHRFIIHSKQYGVAYIDGITFRDATRLIKLSDLGLRVKEKIIYELAELLVERTGSELLYLEAKFAPLVSYGLSMKLFEEALPIGAEINASTIRNQQWIPNYGEQWRAGETISTAFVESAVDQGLSKRFVKKQQMSWSRRGAHLLLQVRTRVLNEELRDRFDEWYPGFNTKFEDQARAA